MKRKLTLLLIATACVLGMDGQIVLTQNFNSTNSVVTGSQAWVRTNNSQPLGTTSWFIGNPSVFTAYNGADSAYFAANFFSTLGTGTISSWLISPTVSLSNGGVLQFATRTTSTTVNPDRLEVYMSQGSGTSVGNTPTSVGTFTTQLLSINPNLTNNGYPGSWTVYTATVSGITGTVTGRFGFRYFVTNGGPTGSNSSYIGLDAVQYALPCANPTLSVLSSTTGVCSGNSAVITATGATTYTWSNGSNSPSIAVSPTATTVYTLTASSIPNCNSSTTIAITSTLTPNLSVSDVTTCAGTAATLMVNGASSYSWNTGATTASIVVTPTTASSYTVTGYNGTCEQSKIVNVAIGASLSINAMASASLVCSGQSVSLTAMGGSSYSWSPGNSQNAVAVVNPTTATVYTVTASSGTCMGMTSVSVAVNPIPSLTVVPATPSVVCISSPLSFSVSGAATYSWIGVSSTTSLASSTSPSVAGTYTIGVVGTGTNGCSATAVVSRSVSACTGIETLDQDHSTLSVFPNPFNSELRVSAAGAERVEFYNALGQQVSSQKAGVDPLQVGDLAKGIYILKVYGSENRLMGTVKVIKN